MSQEIVTTSFEETQELGTTFAKNLQGGVIALHGNLGSGKTTFVQGLAKGLGIKRGIISPTFIIMRTYEVESNSETEVKKFYHVDLYRIETEHDVEGLGLIELMNDPNSIVVIEWPDKIEHLLPQNRTDIYFNYLEDDKRQIVFSN